MDAGLCGVLGQHGHHAGRGAEASGVHTDATLLAPEDAHHRLCRDAPCQGRRGPSGLRLSPLKLWEGREAGPHPIHSLTLPLLQQLLPGPEAGLGSLHAHRLLGQGEGLGKVKGTLPTPPALGPGMGPELRVFC